MASNFETFFDFNRYAVVGHSAAKPFPILTYKGLKKLGKRVFAIDASAKNIDGDAAYADLSALPETVEAVVIEAPKEETRDWVARAAEAGIKDVWIHMAHETPEAVALAEEKHINLRTGTCAVMYLKPGFSPHGLHGLIMKALGKY
ncbi:MULTISPECIES: CoA-binding protein [Thiorhodovibrio]|uniref:CoA-binding protein n=1 Tax=Thiorhodovibrio TaxID=61593 RepID=UPI001912B32C|nr:MULTISPECIES: CoA-binding protein [Thiorhodovibrio]MBK5970664.1 CoA-binding protein [Thiorhodovibrio winogradskyi]WPL14206.1 acetyl coenzyme A synthetase (ADP forming), alpha domain [Thiorhodovibrio litoralis]